MSTHFLTSYFCNLPDSQRSGPAEPDDVGRLCLARTAAELGMDTTVLVDFGGAGLSAEFKRQWSGTHIEFVEAETMLSSITRGQTVYCQRWEHYRNWLALASTYTKYEFVCIADGFDVVVRKDPTELMRAVEGRGKLLLASEEYQRIGDDSPEACWLDDEFKRCWGDTWERHRDRLLGQPILNAGLVMGRPSYLRALASRIVNVCGSTRNMSPHLPLGDMAQFNEALHSVTQGKFESGWPFHSRFKSWEEGQAGHYIAHK